MNIPKLTRPLVVADICLVVYEENLVQLGTERHILLSESDDSYHRLNAERLAKAARHLLPDTTLKQHLALLLPAHEFVSARVNMPGVAAASLHDAVRLQQPMLLPGFTAPLLLIVQAPSTPTSQHLALWLSATRANELYQAFQQQGLFLSCILPRPLGALAQNGDKVQGVRDEDHGTVTYLEWQDGTVMRWLYMPKDDCQESLFKEQFEQNIGTEGAAAVRQTTLEDWKNLRLPSQEVCRYCFTPPLTQQELLRRRKQRQMRFLQIAAGVLLVALIAAIGGALFIKKKLERELIALKEQTTDVSRLREEIFSIEEQIGPVRDFPHQDAVALLAGLNTIIPKDSWISSFKLIDGTVEIEGESPNPQALLEVLVQQPEFINVALGQTQGNKFRIDFHLTGIDVQAYLNQYFPPDAR